MRHLKDARLLTVLRREGLAWLGWTSSCSTSMIVRTGATRIDHLRTLANEFPDLRVTRRLVETPEEADRVDFRGSPTILVDGVDPFADESDPVGGLSCRVYETADGPAGSPTLDQLRRAFATRG